MVVVGNLIAKFLCSIELSTTEQSIKVLKCCGCWTYMIDYIKPIARNKPATILLHVEQAI